MGGCVLCAIKSCLINKTIIPIPINQCILFLVNFGGKLPLNFYNLLNEEMHKKGEATEYGNAPGVNQALANPNTLNRPFAWPVKIRSSMSPYYQVQWSMEYSYL